MYSQANRVAVCYKRAGKKSRTTLQSMIRLLSLNTHLSLVFTLLGFCGFKRFWFLFVCLFFLFCFVGYFERRFNCVTALAGLDLRDPPASAITLQDLRLCLTTPLFKLFFKFSKFLLTIQKANWVEFCTEVTTTYMPFLNLFIFLNMGFRSSSPSGVLFLPKIDLL